MEPDEPSAQSGRGEAGIAETLTLRSLTTVEYLRAEKRLTAEQRTALALHLAAALAAGEVGSGPAVESEAILRLIIWNSEPPVLAAVARVVAHNDGTPHGIVWALANDDDEIALPVLQASRTLSDTDLVAIVAENGSPTKWSAIAGRPAVSSEISHALAQHADEPAVYVLLRNQGADIPDEAFACVLDRHGAHARIQEGIVDRESVPPAISERLLVIASPELVERLQQRHGAAQTQPSPPRPPELDGGIIGYPEQASPAALDAAIAELIAQRGLTPATVLGKLCGGNFDFFSAALAMAARAPRETVRAQLRDPAADALPDLWTAAALPPDWLPIARAGLAALLHIDRHYSKADPLLFRRNVMERAMALLKAEKHTLTAAQRNFFRNL